MCQQQTLIRATTANKFRPAAAHVEGLPIGSAARQFFFDWLPADGPSCQGYFCSPPVNSRDRRHSAFNAGSLDDRLDGQSSRAGQGRSRYFSIRRGECLLTIVFARTGSRHFQPHELANRPTYFHATFEVAAPEEAAKVIVLVFFCSRYIAYDHPMEGVVYGAAVGLGFAAYENLF